MRGSKKKARLLYAKPSGSTGELKCLAEGIPTPTIRWQKNGAPFTHRTLGKVSTHIELEKYMTLYLHIEASDLGN